MKNLKDYIINEDFKLKKKAKISKDSGPIGFSDLADMLMKLDTRYGKPIEIKSLNNDELIKENALYCFMPTGDLYYLINKEVEKNDDDVHFYNFFIRVATMQESTPKDMISISLEEYNKFGLWQGNKFNLGGKNKKECHEYNWFFLNEADKFVDDFGEFLNSLYNLPLKNQLEKMQAFNEFCVNGSSIEYFDIIDDFNTIL